MLSTVFSLVIVSFLWGATNPLIKRGSKDIVKVKGSNAFKQFLLEIKYLATNLEYLAPMALNQLGSVLYFVMLQHLDLSLIVPFTNSLTFVFTALSSRVLGEKPASGKTYLGMLLIIMGTGLCCYDKYLVEQNLVHRTKTEQSST